MAEVQSHICINPVVSETLLKMYNNKKYSDTIFLVNEMQFHASSHVVSVSCAILESMLDEHFENCGDRVVKIGPIKYGSSFSIILKYIYGFQLNFAWIRKGVLCEVLHLAKEYDLKFLFKDLGGYLSKFESFEIDSIVPLMNTAKKLSLQNLYKKAQLFVYQNAGNLLNHGSLVDLRYDVLLDFVKSDLFCADEFEILKAALTWHDSNIMKISTSDQKMIEYNNHELDMELLEEAIAINKPQEIYKDLETAEADCSGKEATNNGLVDDKAKPTLQGTAEADGSGKEATNNDLVDNNANQTHQGTAEADGSEREATNNDLVDNNANQTHQGTAEADGSEKEDTNNDLVDNNANQTHQGTAEADGSEREDTNNDLVDNNANQTHQGTAEADGSEKEATNNDLVDNNANQTHQGTAEADGSEKEATNNDLVANSAIPNLQGRGTEVLETSKKVLISLLSHIRFEQISAVKMHKFSNTALFAKYKEFLSDFQYSSTITEPRKKSPLVLFKESDVRDIIQQFSIKMGIFHKSERQANKKYQSVEEALIGDMKLKLCFNPTYLDKHLKLNMYLHCLYPGQKDWECTIRCQVKLISYNECSAFTQITPQDGLYTTVTLSSNSPYVPCGNFYIHYDWCKSYGTSNEFQFTLGSTFNNISKFEVRFKSVQCP